MSIIPPPKHIALSELLPDKPLLLMGAGPVPIPDAVAKANGLVINHLGETMDAVIERVKLMAQYAFQTKSKNILGISGPATAAMEMAITSLLWKGRKILVLQNGTFSSRFAELAQGVGANVTVIETQNFRPFTLEQVQEATAKDQYDVLSIVQGETSCGLLNKNLKKITQYCHQQKILTIVDAVCTLTTTPLEMDRWNIDIALTGGQKGLSSIPGVSLIAFSNQAWEVVKKRSAPMPHWVLDPKRAAEFWHHKKYHYTAPVPGILAMHEALRFICQEGLQNRFLRHKVCSEALQLGLEAMGLDLFIPKENRFASVVSISIPNDIDSNRLRGFMIKNHHVEISGAFGLPLIRIGQMGEQCRAENIFKTVYALGMALKDQKFPAQIAKAMSATELKLEELKVL